jgi:aminoglycoside 3-N-acetyltransferase
MNDVIFTTGSGDAVTTDDFGRALRSVGAHDCDLLFIHTKLSFGAISGTLKRRDLCDRMYRILTDLGVRTLVFPTFTFSYGNREDFDVRTTPTKMGAINEYIRKLPEAHRSVDPMMSVVSIGEDKNILNITGVKSLGEGSIFDNLHHTDGVKFLFLGTRLSECGTHMHYIEEQLRVPYRYDMDFYGHVTDYEGNTTEDHRILYVKYRDVIPCMPHSYEDMLMDKGILLHEHIGDGDIYTISETDMYRELSASLEQDVNVFLAEPYDTHPPVKEYRYGNVTTVQ